jgi:hypothetical protein
VGLISVSGESRYNQGMNKKCIHCGSSDFCRGEVTGDQRIRFRPDSMKFLTLSFGVRTTVFVCMNCGAATTFVDPDEVRDLLADPREDLRFSMRSLLIFLTLAATVLGIIGCVIWWT